MPSRPEKTGTSNAASSHLTPLEPLLHERDAARIIGMQPSWLARQRWKGEEPNFIKAGRAVRYEPAELRRWIDAHRCSTELRGGRR